MWLEVIMKKIIIASILGVLSVGSAMAQTTFYDRNGRITTVYPPAYAATAVNQNGQIVYVQPQPYQPAPGVTVYPSPYIPYAAPVYTTPYPATVNPAGVLGYNLGFGFGWRR